MGYNDWSPDSTPNRKPAVIQVPDSSPSPVKDRQPPAKQSYSHTMLFNNVKPKPLYDANGNQTNKSATSSSLREKFAFNGSNLLQKKLGSNNVKDLEILQGIFKTLSASFIKAVYTSKGASDLRMTKEILASIIEKRKQKEVLERMEKKNRTPEVIHVKSSQNTTDDHIEISSSPDVSPKRSISSKVVLNKSKTISEKYSHNYKFKEPVLKQPPPVIQVDDEPVLKKRRLVRGSRNTPQPEVQEIVQEIDDDKDEEEEKEEKILNDDFSDSDVEEENVDESEEALFQEKVLEFFNSSEDRDIVDVTGCTMEMAQAVVAKRPFRSITHFESFNFLDAKKRRAKTDGDNLSQKANLVLRGYAAVENLVKQCKSYSDKIAKDISGWGVKVEGVNEELEIVDVDFDDDEDIVGSSKRVSRNGYFREKPKYLSDDVTLKNYQQVGLNWLYLLYKNKLSCILADEMGLGKTCQVISFFAHLKERNIDGPHLVVVPSSTLENWMREFKKFAPSLVVEPYYGSQAEREDIRDSLGDRLDEIDVMVTTYNMASGSKEDHGFLKHAGFNVIVFDEGHMLKNSASERFTKLMKLRAKFRLLLTGTPLQNNLRELMSLLEFILPSIFVSKKEDLKYVFSQRASTSDNKKDYNPLLSERAISKAKKMMAPFILRRKKDQVLQHLPKKFHSVETCAMVPSQERLYLSEVANARILREEKKSRIANILMSLRKAAIHPLLFRYLYNDDILRKIARDIMREDVYATANEEYIFEDLQVMSDFEITGLCAKFSNSIGKYQLEEKEFLESGKISKLKEIITPIIQMREKVLIFSMFTQVLDILEHVLSNWKIKFLRLDGSTAVDIRQDIIDTFYEDETIPVFLLSTKAGGFGINLVCANHVVIFDQSFNPHDDKQAEDRAHRVGQEKEVHVIKLISEETIEENMYLVAQNKLELDQSMSGEQIENKAVSYIDQMVFEENKPEVKTEEKKEKTSKASKKETSKIESEKPGEVIEVLE